MGKISIFSLILKVFVTLLILIVLSFIYAYLTALNPLVYINVVIWYYFGTILIIPISILSINDRYKIPVSILISCLTVYIVYGMKSSIFMTTTMAALLSEGSMWLPKVKFGDLISTLTSFSEFKLKLDILTEYDSLNLSFKGKKSVDTGEGFTNFFRIVECLGLLILPIYQSFNHKKEDNSYVENKSTAENTTELVINPSQSILKSMGLFKTDKGEISVELNFEGAIPALNNKVYQNDKPANDGKYKLGFMNYLIIQDGTIVDMTSF
jgi:hypothetical protein